MNQSILQSQISRNSRGIRNLTDSIKFLKHMIEVQPSTKYANRKTIRKRRKDIKSMEVVQKGMKNMLADFLNQERLNKAAEDTDRSCFSDFESETNYD